MEIKVYGQPAPQGSKKFKGVTKTGKGIIVDTSDKLAPWRNCVCTQAIEELDRIGRPAPFADAVRVAMHFTFNRPKSVSRSKRLYMSIAPDLSKLVRATEDGLTDAGVWTNDALVVFLLTTKNYCNEGLGLERPGCFITVQPVVPLDMPPGRGYLELEGSDGRSQEAAQAAVASPEADEPGDSEALSTLRWDRW